MEPNGPSNVLKSGEWLQMLANLDITSEEALLEFLSMTYYGNVEPIPLGAHKNISYFLETTTDRIPARSDISLTPLDRMRGVSDYVKSYEFEPLPKGGGPRPDFRYGFALGNIMYQGGSTRMVQDAGFSAVFNVIDKSVWAVVNMRPFETANTEFRTDPLPPTWGLLQQDNEMQIGMMKISQLDWSAKSPPVLAAGDPFGTFPAYGWQLISKPAALREFGGE